jgi:uncharacterized protein with PIN domain
VIVVDSSTLIAILRREPEADTFLHIISEADGCRISSRFAAVVLASLQLS